MTRNDLYDLERDVNKNIDRIKREQEEYRKGVEYGIELMFKAVREKLLKEEEEKERKDRKDCSNCERKGRGDIACKSCRITNTSSTPSNWQPIPEKAKGE